MKKCDFPSKIKFVPILMAATDAKLEPTSAPLLAAAFVIDSECKYINDLFMKCREQSKVKSGNLDGLYIDAGPCLSFGDRVTECVSNLFDKIGSSECQVAFNRYWRCLDMNNHNFMYCRDEEIEFHACTKEKLVITLPSN